MKALLAFTVTCILWGSSTATRGYIITAPNRFIPGRPEKVCVELVDVKSEITVELTLLKDKNDTQPLSRASLTLNSANTSKCTSLTAPWLPDDVFELTLTAQGHERYNVHGGWTFTDSRRVGVLSKWISSTLVFIQTDKPIYKPGQLVQFRIALLDSILRPVKDMITNVILETPGKVRVQQWDNVTTQIGMTQLEFQLSDEPELGEWTISLNVKGNKETKTFRVEEYVLPRYEVAITPPKYITFQSESVAVEICAKYTFGKPVRGDVEGNVCLKRNEFVFFDRSGDSNNNMKTMCSSFTVPISSGCVTKIVTREEVGWFNVTQWTWGYSLAIDATVKEQGTGVVLNATTVSLDFSQYDISVTMEGPDKFKPGLAYNGKVVVKRLDDVPAPNKLIEISISNWRAGASYSKNYTSDADGLVFFTIPPIVDGTTSLSIQARAVDYVKDFWSWNAPSAWLSAEGWFSPTGSFLQFQPEKRILKCRETAMFSVQYTTSAAQNTTAFIKVVGAGDIAHSGSTPISLDLGTAIDQPDLDNGWDRTITNVGWWWFRPVPVTPPKQVIASHKGKFSVSVPITAAMAPHSHVVVYYVRADGEVVADRMEIEVEACTENKAELKFSKETVLPGEEVNLTLAASPNSLCGYGVVDKSVILKGGNNQLSLADVVNRLSDFELGTWTGSSNDGFSGCRASSPQPDNGIANLFRTRGSCGFAKSYKDSSDGFKDAGMIVMTGFTINVSPCTPRSCIFARGRGMMLAMAGAPGPETSDIGIANGAPGPQSSNPPQEKIQAVDVRTYFPETWLWDLATIGAGGETVIHTKAPHTITQWIGNSLCINEHTGFGVSPAASLTTFQPFFIEMTVPYSVIRGEKVPIPLTVSNYLKECLAVKVSLLSTEGYTVQGMSSNTICVCGSDTQTQTFNLIMDKIGDVNISINALTVSNRSVCSPTSVMSSRIGVTDTVIKPLIVRPEGAPREYTTSDFICLKSAAGNDTNTTSQYNLPLPGLEALVKDSARAYVKVVGDVMGPALSNLDNLLQMPGGCGEQNIASMSPNIFVLKYFEAIHKDRPELREKAIQNIQSGYQNELRFEHPDGSFSAWGPTSSGEIGSTWLTAFVVKIFGQASRYITVDNDRLAKSRKFFTDHQQTDGCFPMIGMVHSKYMQGGIGNNEGNNAALTAFTLVAMMEAGAKSDDPSIVNGFRCLDGKQFSDAYITSIAAYAYALYKPQDPKAVAMYNKLLLLAKTDSAGGKFWKANESEPVTPAGTWWWFRPVSADIETSAYALLAILRMNSGNRRIEEGLPVVRWLSKQRNSYGGFGSTQDTVIGIQALAEFATLIYSDGLNANIQVTEKMSRNLVGNFVINQDNSFVELSKKMANVVDLELRAQGRGCFLFQANVRYNVKQVDNTSQPFITSVTATGSGFKCIHQSLHVCTRYIGEGGVSNMAIIEVKMPSGWVPDQSSLKALVKDANVALKKYEVDKDYTVQMYFNKLDGSNKCFDFAIDQEVQITDLKPAVVTTYDYYKTELRQETTYSVTLC